MTGNQLRDFIDMFQLGNYEVAVGCKGITNTEDLDNGLINTKAEMVDGKILIHDGMCHSPSSRLKMAEFNLVAFDELEKLYAEYLKEVEAA